MFRLFPSVIALRRDRKRWIAQSKEPINEEEFRKNAARTLDTFIALGPVYIKLGQWLGARGYPAAALS